MLPELDKVLREDVQFLSIQCDPTLSPIFLMLHFVEKFLKNDSNVIFVSLHSSINLLKVVSGKMAIRIDTKRFNFLQFGELLGNSLTEKYLISHYEEKITKLIDNERKNLLIFDDFDSVCQLCQLSAFGDLQFLQRIRQKLPDSSLLVIVGNDAEFLTLSVVDSVFRIKPIASGFGNNVTGELEIQQRNAFRESHFSSQIFHYLTGERSSKLFYPGTVQILI